MWSRYSPTSESASGGAHPPRSKPPRRSSSGPPNPCTTPSRVMFVVVINVIAMRQCCSIYEVLLRGSVPRGAFTIVVARAGGSRGRSDEIGKVSQRVVEVVRPERREADVLADIDRDR